MTGGNGDSNKKRPREEYYNYAKNNEGPNQFNQFNQGYNQFNQGYNQFNQGYNQGPNQFNQGFQQRPNQFNQGLNQGPNQFNPDLYIHNLQYNLTKEGRSKLSYYFLEQILVLLKNIR